MGICWHLSVCSVKSNINDHIPEYSALFKTTKWYKRWRVANVKRRQNESLTTCIRQLSLYITSANLFTLGKLDETWDAKQTEACINLPSLRSLRDWSTTNKSPLLKVYSESKQGRPGYRFINGQLVPIRKALWTGIASQESQTNRPSAVCPPQTSFCIHRASPSDDPGQPAALPQTQVRQRDLSDHGSHCKASWESLALKDWWDICLYRQIWLNASAEILILMESRTMPIMYAYAYFDVF